jgi:chromosome segregation ATPase
MGFEYNKHKKESGDSMWTSYSDLFLGLSIIFLLLYVSASLKQGTDGIKQHIEYKRLQKENEDLQQQIKAYETLKQDYLQRQASVDEQDNYKELMDKLALLQDEAKDEKVKLRLQANENEKKEKALNQYQQMIRNIINSNMVAKARIKSRDTMIDTKEDVITEKTGEISNLEQDVAQKQQVIQQTQAKADSLENQLDKRMKQLRSAYKAQNISKKKFEQRRAQIQTEYEGKIAKIREQQAVAKAEFDRASAELAETNRALVQTQGQLQNAKGNIAALDAKNQQLKGALTAADQKFQAETAAMRGKFAAQAAAEKAAFEKALAGERLSGTQKAARERAFAEQALNKARALEGQIGNLGKELGATRGALAKAAADAAEADAKARAAIGYAQGAAAKVAAAEGKANALAGELAGTKGELARAQENLNAKKKLAEQIMKNFAAKGVKADVDARSGDVMLEFGDQYFDTGRADLKPKMRSVLEKAMPAYSASLFDDPKVASKIQAVEIVGFASPTYKGKFINPKSLDPDDRKAVNYNLDLSYNRARSIFNYVFDKNKMSFKHQKQLLPLVKVTGRSFLSNDDRTPASGGSAEEFCRKNDCAKLQRVIIKFQLKD